MGAESFVKEVNAESARAGFDKLIEYANIHDGIDSYNGSINTCMMGVCTDSFGTYSEKNEIRMRKKIADTYGYGEKWEASYIDLGAIEYVVTTVKKKNKEYTAKYKQKFVVFNGLKEIGCFDTKPKADEKAMKLKLENPNADIYVKKTMVNLKGNDVVSEFEIEEKKYKSKPKLKPMPNRKVTEIHKYLFYGYASC